MNKSGSLFGLIFVVLVILMLVILGMTLITKGTINSANIKQEITDIFNTIASKSIPSRYQTPAVNDTSHATENQTSVVVNLNGG